MRPVDAVPGLVASRAQGAGGGDDLFEFKPVADFFKWTTRGWTAESREPITNPIPSWGAHGMYHEVREAPKGLGTHVHAALSQLHGRKSQVGG